MVHPLLGVHRWLTSAAIVPPSCSLAKGNAAHWATWKLGLMRQAAASKSGEHLIQCQPRPRIECGVLLRPQLFRFAIQSMHGREVVSCVCQLIVADARGPRRSADDMRRHQIVPQQRVGAPRKAILALCAVKEVGAGIAIVAEAEAGKFEVKITFVAAVVGHWGAEAADFEETGAPDRNARITHDGDLCQAREVAQ